MATELRQRKDAERRERTRRKLLDATARVILKKGYRETLISDIVADAGVGQGTFYRNFTNMREALETLFDDFAESLFVEFSDFSENLPESVEEYREASIGAITRMAEILFKNRDLALLFLREGPAIDGEFEARIDEALSGFADLARGYLEYAIDSGFARPCDAGVVSQCLVGMARRHLDLGLKQDQSLEELRWKIREVIDFAFLGFAPRDA